MINVLFRTWVGDQSDYLKVPLLKHHFMLLQVFKCVVSQIQWRIVGAYNKLLLKIHNIFSDQYKFEFHSQHLSLQFAILVQGAFPDL